MVSIYKKLLPAFGFLKLLEMNLSNLFSFANEDVVQFMS